MCTCTCTHTHTHTHTQTFQLRIIALKTRELYPRRGLNDWLGGREERHTRLLAVPHSKLLTGYNTATINALSNVDTTRGEKWLSSGYMHARTHTQIAHTFLYWVQ